MKTSTNAALPVPLTRLVRLVESAISATIGRMTLDIHMDDDLTESITAMITEYLGYGTPEEAVPAFVIRRIFGNHEERLIDAARDDANGGMHHALRSLPNVESIHPESKPPRQ